MIKHNINRFSFFTIILILCMCFLRPENTTAEENQSLRIENVFTNTSSFTPAEDKEILIHFQLSKKSAVTLTIYDSLNRGVAALLNNVVLPAGNHQASWNGLDIDGKTLPHNYYVYTIEAKSTDEESVRYDPTDITGGKQIGIQNIEYDRGSDQVSFTLKQAAILNMRVGMTGGGPMMNTLIDWLPLKAGQHTIKWDGKDNTGTVNLKEIKLLSINGPAYSLPMNAIILRGEAGRSRPLFLPNSKTTGKFRPITVDPTKRILYNHWQHPRNKCYDPELIIVLPEDQKYDNDGAAIIDGPLRISLNVHDADRQFLLDQRFEIVLYVDFIFSHEEESGHLPYFWTWDPRGIEGMHYITAMLRGYDGHFSTRTVKMSVSRKQLIEQ